ncbi:MAG TPA: hypothetical protein RMF84_03655 [Polyangiaceae bacterium LLY-WYZ-14_1]|nr:hypothetical protein [Polyangiaceae bacterium LLY-WYZ-14_1]
MSAFTTDLASLGALVFLGAFVILAHAAVIWVSIRPRSGLNWGWQLFAVLLPPFAPVAAFRARRGRLAAITWGVLVVAYLAVYLAWTRD